MRLSFIAVPMLTLALSGCEIVASFDRDKIPPPTLMRPDASFFPPPGNNDPLDGGPSDASLDGATDATIDSSITDRPVEGGMSEASVEGGADAQVDDGSTPTDASPADGSATDASPADGSTPDASPADGSTPDAA